jgi:kumamolisin
VALAGSEPPPAAGEALAGPAPPDAELSLSVYLASGAPVQPVVDFARSYGLEVQDVDEAAGRVRLRGRAPEVAAAFGVELHAVRRQEATYLRPSGPVRLPESIAPYVTAVLGMDNRPVARRPEDA